MVTNIRNKAVDNNAAQRTLTGKVTTSGEAFIPNNCVIKNTRREVIIRLENTDDNLLYNTRGSWQ